MSSAELNEEIDPRAPARNLIILDECSNDQRSQHVASSGRETTYSHHMPIQSHQHHPYFTPYSFVDPQQQAHLTAHANVTADGDSNAIPLPQQLLHQRRSIHGPDRSAIDSQVGYRRNLPDGQFLSHQSHTLEHLNVPLPPPDSPPPVGYGIRQPSAPHHESPFTAVSSNPYLLARAYQPPAQTPFDDMSAVHSPIDKDLGTPLRTPSTMVAWSQVSRTASVTPFEASMAPPEPDRPPVIKTKGKGKATTTGGRKDRAETAPRATHFKSLAEAMLYLDQSKFKLTGSRGSKGIPTSDIARLPYVLCIATALASLEDFRDPPHSDAVIAFGSDGHWKDQDVEAAAHVTVDRAIQIYSHGATAQAFLNRSRPVHSYDTSVTFEGRIKHLEHLFKQFKFIADRIVKLDEIEETVAAPYTRLLRCQERIPDRRFATQNRRSVPATLEDVEDFIEGPDHKRARIKPNRSKRSSMNRTMHYTIPVDQLHTEDDHQISNATARSTGEAMEEGYGVDAIREVERTD